WKVLSTRMFQPLRFFFFQAEDGIRDSSVTGVQTCALPISGRAAGRAGLTAAVLCSLRNAGPTGACGRSQPATGQPDRDPTPGREIGRASCRERVEMGGWGGCMERKSKRATWHEKYR